VGGPRKTLGGPPAIRALASAAHPIPVFGPSRPCRRIVRTALSDGAYRSRPQRPAGLVAASSNAARCCLLS